MATSSKTVQVQLDLSEKEARFIMNIMQNAFLEPGQTEPEDQTEMRYSIFEALNAEVSNNGS